MHQESRVEFQKTYRHYDYAEPDEGSRQRAPMSRADASIFIGSLLFGAITLFLAGLKALEWMGIVG